MITASGMGKRDIAIAFILAISLGAASTGCAIARWPVEGTLTSPYGFRMRGWHPDLHNGVDVSAPEGTPIQTMRAGTVVRAGEMTGYGLGVIIEHNRNLRTIYGHMSRIAVKQGAHVNSRDIIGNVGHTGNATGPHLHFEIWRHGHSEDPVPLLGGFPPAPEGTQRSARTGH